MKSGIRFGFLATTLLILSTHLMGCASTPGEGKSISKKERIQSLLAIAAANVTDNDSISAIETLNKVRDLDDSIAEIYYLYSLAYLNKNEIRLATDSARHAVRLDPKYSAAKNALGKLLLDQGKFDEAEKHLTQSSSDLLFRDAYLSKINLGILYYKKMNYARSNQMLTEAINQGNNPLTCMAYFYRGKVALAQSDLHKAERDLNKSIKGSCSGMSEAHLALGQTLVRAKKFDQARSKFIDIQRMFPSSDAFDQANQYLREIP